MKKTRNSLQREGELPAPYEQHAYRTARAYVLVRGVVQGVGFRPYIHRLAATFGLHGWVLNSTEGVEIEVEGPPLAVRDFVAALPERRPPLSQIDFLQVVPLPPVGYTSFSIQDSQETTDRSPLISPDIATCPDCLADLNERGNRRYHYPFVNCTNCGPRFTIVDGVPYDRPKTTMRHFTMCPACQCEYDHPADRRFHAQPNACPACGPRVWLHPASHVQALPGDAKGDPVAVARRFLREGRILAIKGLGGFHLACDATNETAVAELRIRKLRVEKPFAIMVRDLVAAEQVCHVVPGEAQLLDSPRRPIVLLERKPGVPIALTVAPHNARLGVMLTYTPLHHLLLAADDDGCFTALVMTSGNLSGEPIAIDNEEALQRLDELADYFLLHDRPIRVRCDDSVTQVFEGKEMVLRRSRGYAPLPVRLNFDLPPILACGGELKNAFCLTKGSYAFLSQHIGDLENEETLESFTSSVAHFGSLFHLSPRVLAHDLHPNYLSTRYALALAAGERSFAASSPPSSDGPANPGLASLGQPAVCADLVAVGVQHHHAHIASCLAENGLDERVIGVAFDGTGYGTDGAVWGGEFLIADYAGFRRAAHLQYRPLPGGDVAVRRPYRMALSHLRGAFGQALPDLPFLRRIAEAELRVIDQQIAKGINSPPTSSCGRLFDAVSALIGVRDVVNYEGQAALELEMRADSEATGSYTFALTAADPLEIDTAPLIAGIVGDLLSGVSVETISGKFHHAVAIMIAQVCDRLRLETGLAKVCLSGGVFQNRLLLRRALGELEKRNFSVFYHHQVPCNDGGLALGQAMVAARLGRIAPQRH